MLKNTLRFIVLPLAATAVSAYEMAFLEDMDPNIQNYDPDEVIWNLYNPGIGCTAIPPNPSNYVQEVIIRVPPEEDEPPALIAFFDNGALPGSPGHATCDVDDITFIVHWYELPDSQQMYFTIDGSVTHFSEIRHGSYLGRFFNQLEARTETIHEGDVLIKRYLDGAPGWEVLKDDVEFSVPYIPMASEEAEYGSRSQSVGSMGAELMEQPGAPSRQQSVDTNHRSNRPGDQPALNSIEEEIEIERAPAAIGNREEDSEESLDAFEEMYLFERNFPNFWAYLVQQLVVLRNEAMAAGTYIPIPQGLRNRYTNEELEALGLPIDPTIEEEMRRALASSRIEAPALYQAMIPTTYQLFTGEDPGLFTEVLADLRGRGDGNAQISDIDPGLLVAAPQLPNLQGDGSQNNVQNYGQPMQIEGFVPNIDNGGVQPEEVVPIVPQAVDGELRNPDIDPDAECLIEDICIERTP
ncbi:hypothetical protein TWF481_000551 [Arthrobotrys musiformis]|uniref:Uncharacterized protein n=1 Tax=Arthrobotrys musiformis TaxID=47236 RepID=A0AAV9WMX2_9PEZI